MLKPELQAKFLQHLNNRKKKNDEGFTLIELLVVVIIIGVLAAIALPSLLGQVNKAKQSEAKQNIGAMNRASQAFFLEYQGFASAVAQLQIGIKNPSENYSYDVVRNTTSTFVQNKAIARKPALKSYFGVVATELGDAATSEALTVAVACESLAPSQSVPTVSAYASDCAVSTTNYTSLAK
ncbi:general secretion pathway protein GspG [Fischerella thermalis CCMEE 5201]|jgi:type IV pilus assembly protein PilA|nr:general secretion pathway protein GspG [Fischerella thermalis CCMEE 5201]